MHAPSEEERSVSAYIPINTLDASIDRFGRFSSGLSSQAHTRYRSHTHKYTQHTAQATPHTDHRLANVSAHEVQHIRNVQIITSTAVARKGSRSAKFSYTGP